MIYILNVILIYFSNIAVSPLLDFLSAFINIKRNIYIYIFGLRYDKGRNWTKRQACMVFPYSLPFSPRS